MKLGIRFKLLSLTTALLLLVIMFMSFFVLNGIKKYQAKENESVLFNQKNLFEQYLYENLGLEDYDSPFLKNGTVFDKPWLNSIPVNIYNIKGKLIYSYGNDGKTDVIAIENKMINYALKGNIAYKTIGDNIYYYSPLKYKNSTVAILRLKYSINEQINFYNNIKALFLILGLISLSISGSIGFIYFINFTNDIKKITYAIESIKSGNFDNLKELKRNDELGDLSRGVSFMSSSLKKSISDLQKERDSLKNAVEELEIMSRKQKDFINNVTHEFKTPLTSIKAYGDLLAMYEDDPNLIKEASKSICKECERLHEMINDVLKLSSINKYDFKIKKTCFNLKSAVEQVCSSMLGRIKRNKLKLQTSIDNININADEASIKNIIINLVDNAIKYSLPEGNIFINAKASKESILIEVADTGIGIPEDSLPKIFDPFYRVKSDRSRKTGGSGLGLSFIKTMLEKQNGSITVTSEENIGSKFTIMLPLELN